MSRQPSPDKHLADLPGDRQRGALHCDLAVQQQAIEKYIIEVEAEYESQRRRLRLTRRLRQELHRVRKLIEIQRVKMIVGSIAIVLLAAMVAGASGQGPLAPWLMRAQHKPFVQRHVPKQTPRPIVLRDPASSVPLGRCTNYMSGKGYRRWLEQTSSQPMCP